MKTYINKNVSYNGVICGTAQDLFSPKIK